ncbi:MAG: phosphoribulokinase [Chloroflexi bacterium]|nr:phosphoribulokinase [Chloroflexota bacterium]
MKTQPVILGIVGDSASGKTTLTNGITEILGRDRVTHICSDDYHRYDRQERAVRNITPLHPDCNYVAILEQHLQLLRDGQPILKPVYDHRNGTFTRPELIEPREFIIVEGLLGFHTPRMRDCYDAKVYLNPPEELRRIWKIKRDCAKRGYVPAQVLAELERREPDSRDFIRPQRQFADLSVRFAPPDGVPAERADGKLNARIIMWPTIPHPDLSDVLERATDGARPPVRLELEREEGRPADFLYIDGTLSAQKAAELEEVVWQHMPDAQHLRPDKIGTYLDGLEARHSDPLALTQLLLVYQMIRAARPAPLRAAPLQRTLA